MHATQVQELLGLPTEHARAYAWLLANGPVTAQALAGFLGRPRSFAYDVLRALVREGLALEQPGRPLTYVPRPVRAALADRIQRTEAQLQTLQEAAIKAEDLPPPGCGPEPGEVALFRGPQATETEACRLVADASRVVAVSGFPLGPADRSAGLARALVHAARRGCAVTVYVAKAHGATPFAQAVRTALPAGALVEHDVAGLMNLTAAVSERAVLYAFTSSASAGRGADEVLGVRIGGSPLPAFTLGALPSLLGGALAQAGSGTEAYLQLLRSAQREVRCMAGPGWSGLRTPEESRTIAEAYAGAQARGVAVRMLIGNDAADLLHLQGLKAVTQRFEVRLGRYVPAFCAIVDGRAAHLSVGSAAEGVRFHLSQDPSEVAWHMAVFDRLWATARPFPDVQGADAR